MSIGLFKLLEEQLGMKQEEAEHYIRFEETPTEHIMHMRTYLEPTSFNKLRSLVKEQGGSYDPTSTPKSFHIPKEKAATTTGESVPNPDISSQGIHSQPTIETSEEYALSRSMKGKLGQLVPCLEDASGVIFDGLHRKQIDPQALTIRVDKVKTPVDRALARMTVNFCRRHYTSEEMKSDIGLLLGSGYSVEQIAENTGISERTVYRYMPESSKKPEAKAISEGMKEKSQLTAVSSSLKTSDSIVETPALLKTPQFVDCERCHVATSTPQDWRGHSLCSSCHKRAEQNPEGFEGFFHYAKKEASVKPPEFTKLPAMPTQDTWEHRKAQMSPQHSSMEQAILARLSTEGVQVMTDFEFCLQKTTPDFWFPKKQVAVYLDGPVHVGREDRDEALRDLLRKRHSVTVLSVPYSADTEQERKRIFDLVAEALK